MAEVREGQAALARLSIDEIIGFCDAAAAAWADPAHPMAAALRDAGMGFVPLWMRRLNLEQWCDLSFHGQRACLDRFTPLPGGGRRLFRAQPRGLAVHWLAGNVPVLGMLSLLQGLLAKNANVLKAPGRDSGLLPNLLASWRGISCDTPSGRVCGETLLRSLAVVYVEHDDQEAARWLSSKADVRVAWGGREAVETIMSLPRRLGTEDIVFGPKVSLALIGAESLETREHAHNLAEALARDTAAFEQRGCNSPHTVFIEKGGKITPKEFAGLAAKALATTASHRPPRDFQPAEAMRLLAVRTEYEMRGEAYYDNGLNWTVAYSEDEEGLAEPCYMRTLFLRPIENVFEAVKFCSRQTQSAGLAAGKRNIELAEALTSQGVERCPHIGSMSLYESPWDGMFPLARMVRWVSAAETVCA
jgi:hypothetical protein